MRRFFVFLSFFCFVCLFSALFASCSSLLGIAGDVVGELAEGVTNDFVSDFAGDAAGEAVGEFVGGVADDVVSGSGQIIEASRDIEPESEYYIGRIAAANVLRNYKLYDDPVLTEYVNKICSAITVNSDMPYLYKGYFVAVVDSDEINAISTPGGHIFISRGLIECAPSEDALAGVIAHEVSHIQLGHSSAAIRGDRGFDAAKKLFLDSINKNSDFVSAEVVKGLYNIGDGFVTKLMKSGFSQAQEFDADKNALKLMASAGYNPYALLDMLGAIDGCAESGAGGGGSGSGGWFKTHPKAVDRVKKADRCLRAGKYDVVDMAPRAGRFQEIKGRL